MSHELKLIEALIESGHSDLVNALRQFVEKKPEDDGPTHDKLKELFEVYSTKKTFKEGETVKWKKGMRDRKLPKYDEPAIVVKVLDTPTIDTSRDSGSHFFMEPMDVILGVVADDNSFITFHFNSQRFERYIV